VIAFMLKRTPQWGKIAPDRLEPVSMDYWAFPAA